MFGVFFFFSSRRRHTRWPRDWSSDVCSSDLDMRRDLEVRAAALEERRALLTRRLEGVDARLSSRDAAAHAEAERRRGALSGRQRAYAEVERRLTASLTQVESLHDRLSEYRRRQSEAARSSGERLDALRTERAM